MALHIPTGGAGLVRTIALFSCSLVFLGAAFGQQPTCTVASGLPTALAEGLTEPVGDISVTCTGGSGPITTLIVVTLNANVTNRVLNDGSLANVAITGSVSSQTPPVLNSPKTVLFGSVQMQSFPAVFKITGLRVAVPTVTGGSGTLLITALVSGNLANFPSQPVSVAVVATGLLSSVLNFGVPCRLGSPTPDSVDFSGLLAAGTSFSAIRITEGSPSAFTPKSASADSGVRFMVNISGYGPNSTVYVPDIIVGNRGTNPTSAGAFGSAQNGGTYTPGASQLLLARVDGADATGAGGAPVAAIPGGVTAYTSVTQLKLVNGAASVTYEVLDANAGVIDSAQIPVFVAVPVASCNTPLQSTLNATIAPTSTASQPTLSDPIPRYVATTPASDCAAIGDCSAPYFPILQISPASITLNGSLFGQPQTGFITVSDSGSGQLTFNVSTTYQTAANQSSANWLSLSDTAGVVGPTAGNNVFALRLTADPSLISISGTYQATVTLSAGSAGTTAVPVTFNVSDAGAVIQSVVNAANSQPGPVAPGSFAAIYGVNLVPKKPPATVTFNGFPASISFDGQPTATSPSQINVLVPAALGSAANAGVVATIDGVVTNTFPVKLAANAPGVFTPGILNQDNSINLAASPASLGDIVQIFLTGLATPVTLPLAVTIGNQSVNGAGIFYAGVSSIPGLEQINVQVPASLSLSGNSAPLSVCVQDSGGPICSAPVNLYLH